MLETGEQLDSAILAYAILLQLMHGSIASCVLHIACCMLRWCKIPLKEIWEHMRIFEILHTKAPKSQKTETFQGFISRTIRPTIKIYVPRGSSNWLEEIIKKISLEPALLEW